MESSYGIICLLPPLVAIVLAIITRHTLFSLVMAVWVGSTIINGWNPVVGFVKIISDYIVPSIASGWNASLLVLVTLAGGLIGMLKVTGAAESFARLTTRVINTARRGQIVTCLSAFIFSYTEPCLILGTIMRPVTDSVRVSRAKLAYILDSMGCNLAAFSPISSYGPFIAGLVAAQLTANHVEANEWVIWARMLPFNIYGLFAMLTVIIVAVFSLDIGPMYKEEKRARETGKLMADDATPIASDMKEELPKDYVPSVWNFALPMICLFAALFATIFWSGKIWENGFGGSFLNGNITLAICMGFICGSIGAGIMGIAGRLFNPVAAFNHFTTGMSNLFYVPFILVCAWSVGSITGQMQVGNFMAGVVGDYLTPGLVPAIVFAFGAVISFATGSSWGVWSIMMPIAFPMAVQFDISLPYVVGAVIGGGLFGDQCSPISDTTIMSSTGASCDHVVHVVTQLPYGLTVGISAFIGFLFGGLTGQYYLSIAVAGIVLYAALFVLTRISNQMYAKGGDGAA